MKETIAFDDVLCVPQYSEVRSRLEPDTSVNIGGINLQIPFIASPMDTVSEAEMCIELGKLGGAAVLHRFLDLDDQIAHASQIVFEKNKYPQIPVIIAVGVTEKEKTRTRFLLEHLDSTLDMIAIDVANGHHILMKEMIEYIQNINPQLSIMAGNIATADGFKFLADLGVKAVRVGIGSGSICSTRIQTGFGVPLLTSILECAKIKDQYPETSLIADGGIKYPKDVVISLVAGADAIMAGSLFAGTKEAPGKIIYTNDGKAWKSYRGMASHVVQQEKLGGLKPGTTAEGVSQLTEYRGSLERVVSDFVGGLRSAMSYANALTIKDLKNVELIKISSSGLHESHAFGTKK